MKICFLLKKTAVETVSESLWEESSKPGKNLRVVCPAQKWPNISWRWTPFGSSLNVQNKRKCAKSAQRHHDWSSQNNRRIRGNNCNFLEFMPKNLNWRFELETHDDSVCFTTAFQWPENQPVFHEKRNENGFSHPSYSPDLDSTYFLFPRMKENLQG